MVANQPFDSTSHYGARLMALACKIEKSSLWRDWLFVKGVVRLPCKMDKHVHMPNLLDTMEIIVFASQRSKSM